MGRGDALRAEMHVRASRNPARCPSSSSRPELAHKAALAPAVPQKPPGFPDIPETPVSPCRAFSVPVDKNKLSGIRAAGLQGLAMTQFPQVGQPHGGGRAGRQTWQSRTSRELAVRALGWPGCGLLHKLAHPRFSCPVRPAVEWPRWPAPGRVQGRGEALWGQHCPRCCHRQASVGIHTQGLPGQLEQTPAALAALVRPPPT